MNGKSQGNKIFTILSMSFTLLLFFRTENPFEELTDNLSIYLDEDGDEGAGYFSRLFFCWVNPLIVKGYKGQLRTVSLHSHALQCCYCR